MLRAVIFIPSAYPIILDNVKILPTIISRKLTLIHISD